MNWQNERLEQITIVLIHIYMAACKSMIEIDGSSNFAKTNILNSSTLDQHQMKMKSIWDTNESKQSIYLSNS